MRLNKLDPNTPLGGVVPSQTAPLSESYISGNPLFFLCPDVAVEHLVPRSRDAELF